MINKKYWYFEVMVFALILLVIIPFVGATASIIENPTPTPQPPPTVPTSEPDPPIPPVPPDPPGPPGPPDPPDPTPPPDPDLIALNLEITQAIQDLKNSVRLVAGKRTVVRFHVRQGEEDYTSTVASKARLHVQQGANGIWLDPLNSGGEIIVRPEPDRSILHHAFTFELPSEYTYGTITLTAELNPPDPASGDRDVSEKDYSNNFISVENLTFEDVPAPDLVLYRVDYQIDGVTYWVSEAEVRMIKDWLERVFPVNDLKIKLRTLDLEEAGEVNAGNELVKPGCVDINNKLTSAMVDDLSSSAIPVGTHFYGLWSDGMGYSSIGCAADIPSLVASGPTGDPAGPFPWDTDGTYGDHFTAHELGHSYGRRHVQGAGPPVGLCGSEAGADPNYPYNGGSISSTQFGDEALYGFDYGTWTIFDPSWKDFMTYCDNLWISDYTYHALMDYFQNHPSAMLASPAAGSQIDRLLVVGSIDLAAGQVALQPIFVIPAADDLEPRTPGDYAIVLRNAGGDELARYPFTPDKVNARSNMGMNAVERDLDTLSISELVPYEAGTALVAIEGPNGVMAEISAGAASPTVTVTAPNGGETLSGGPITVSWTADDPDGDPLSFKVQYSPDNGATWELVAQNITANSVAIPAENLVGGQQALFRVWVSDGIHTSQDTSDAPFSVPNRVPTLEILAPEQDTTVAANQTLSLQGFAYDVDSGFMDDGLLEWHSDRDGFLGNGDQLSVSALSVGVHSITFKADDGAGEVISDTAQVTVVGDLSQLPPLPDTLIVAPTTIKLDSSSGITSDTISIENQNLSSAITWQAVASEPWLELSHTSGMTPFNDLVVSFDSSKLSPGTHWAQVTFSSAQVPGQNVVIPVQAFIHWHHLYLPLTIR